MGINVPLKKSEYLSFGEGSTIEKIKSIVNIISFIGDVKPEDVVVTVLEFGSKTLHYLSDFKPDYYTDGDKIETVEHIDNLLYTAELNPPEEVILTLPNGKELYVTDGSEFNEILDECYDVQSKLNDCINVLRSGDLLDSTQQAFLKMHNIIKE